MTRPNVLNIPTDDLFQYLDFAMATGRFGVAPFGVELYLPNLERLRARSYNFRRAEAPVSICFASRAAGALLLPPSITGLYGNDPLLPELYRPEQLWMHALRRAGYHMESRGKVHHLEDKRGYDPLPAEYYEVLYHNTAASASFTTTASGSPAATYPGVEGGGRGWAPEDEAALFDYQVVSATIARINELGTDRPWYIECGLKSPHEPFDWPQRLYDQIPISSIIKPADWPLSWDILPYIWEDMGESNAGLLNDGYHNFGQNPGSWSPAKVLEWQHSVRNYLVGVLWLDEQLGRLLDALEASVHADNTMIVLWSDHGYHLGDNGRFHKFSTYETACNAVLMVSLPGQTEAVEIGFSYPVSLMDIGPTILDYCGLPTRANEWCMSLRPYFEGNPPEDRLVFSYWYTSYSAAIGNRRISFYQDGATDWYILPTDGWSQRNLAGSSDPQYLLDLERLHVEGRKWGLQPVLEGATLMPNTPMAALVGYNPAVSGQITSSIALLGDLAGARADSPNYKQMISLQRRGQDGKTMHMPPGFRRYRNANSIVDMTIYGNRMDNVISAQQDKKFDAVTTIHGGDGNDEISGRTRRIIAYGGAGNDIVRSSGGGQFFGGDGDDTLIGDTPSRWSEVRGGEGDDYIQTNNGNDEIWAEAGHDTIRSGGGNDTVHVTGGSHLIDLSAGADVLIVSRTGQPQDVTGIAGGTLNLSDWAPIGPAVVTQIGTDVEVTAAMERVICRAVIEADVRAAITGVAVA